MALIAANLFCY